MTETALTPRAEAKRLQLRTAAQKLFQDRGFSGTSTDAIAAAAGVSKETLYRHYRTKEDLLTDVLRHFFADAIPPTLIDRLSLQDDLQVTLRGLARSALGYMMTPDYLALLRIILTEAPHQPSVAALFQTTVPMQAISIIKGILGAAHGRGLIPAVDFDAAARLFVGWMLSFAILDGLFVVDGPPRIPSEAQQEAIVSLFVKAVS
jgi:TetR/AcrR family transcriptional repressor of mexJK operon